MRLTPEHGVCNRCPRKTDLFYCESVDEYLCENCIQNIAEAAYERMCEDFHDGGSTAWPDAERKRMEEARKLK